MNTRITNNHLAILQPQYSKGQNQNIGRDQTPADNSRRGLEGRENTAASEFVLSGELLDPMGEDKRYRPQYNQQIAPQNRHAIEVYHNSESRFGNSDPRGRLLDQFV
ncbi:MAG: hypothetical protein GY820_23250 [Gammaproteobacteria bacterium]|nr:hypothetical protein [Gammaproteobacteria bacterium]